MPCDVSTVEPHYNEVLGTMKITLLYQISRYIRIKKQINIKSWDQQNDLVIRGFCYIQPLYNEVPLYTECELWHTSIVEVYINIQCIVARTALQSCILYRI